MTRLSITAAWNETAALVKREGGLFFLVAFGLISLPTVILQAAMPTAAPGQAPEGGAWTLLIIPAIALSIIGSLTITNLALGRAGDARDAFSSGLRRFPVVLAAAFLLGLIAALVALPVAFVLVLVAGTGAGSLALLTAAIVAAFLFVWVRMMLLNPVGAAEPLGPLAILRRSWHLTKGQSLKLLGFVFVLLIVFVVLTVAVAAVFGSVVILLAGQPRDGNLAEVLILLMNGLLNAGLAIVLTVMVARIYAQLVGRPSSGS